ncbi:hypothetical protein LTR78_003634 [Recurvomyces mirabilis]|uniref:Uncharacterized protein n=1 Tax=Recurvomyces mirabilis TaxID=574656 RepID=A0AAE0WRA9_9PEZI|nr:hypothetical protein LTR78_003634 [Recurvomyces mirabilis]KAK5154748.1 hypothetical protein LTS14_006327 [Recurvomyces mirabilis]
MFQLVFLREPAARAQAQADADEKAARMAKDAHDARIRRIANRRINKALQKKRLENAVKKVIKLKYQILRAARRFDKDYYLQWLAAHPEDAAFMPERGRSLSRWETYLRSSEADATAEEGQKDIVGEWRAFSFKQSASERTESGLVVSIGPKGENGLEFVVPE